MGRDFQGKQIESGRGRRCECAWCAGEKRPVCVEEEREWRWKNGVYGEQGREAKQGHARVLDLALSTEGKSMKGK